MSRFTRLPAFIGSASLVVGLVSVLGWHFELAWLLQVSPNIAPMQYNAAVCLAFFGMAFLALSRKNLRAAAVLSGITFLITILTSLEFQLDQPFGIDQLIFRPFLAAGILSPRRMGPNASLSFVLLSLSLAMYSRLSPGPLKVYLVTSLASLAGAMGMVALFGYSSHLKAAYGWGEMTPLAPQLALMIALAGTTLVGLGARENAVTDLTVAKALGIAIGLALFINTTGLAAAVAAEAPADSGLFSPAKGIFFGGGLIAILVGALAYLLLIARHRQISLETTNAALFQKTVELERSNEEITQLAYVVAHDLQEPLRSIVGSCQLLDKRFGNQLLDEGHEFIELAVTSSKRMHELINGLMRYCSVGPSRTDLEIVALESIFSRSLHQLSGFVKDSAALITHDPLPDVKGHAPHLTQLFHNLLRNTLIFRSREAPVVHVSVCQRGRQWQITIKDNGIGIDAAYANRIFEMFETLHPKGVYPGIGMGLPIAKKIVDNHGGRIWVESQLGQGSRFYVMLPSVDNASQ